MYVIAGLGNPTLPYKGTRHNVGFEVIDVISEKYGIPVKEHRYRGLIGQGMIGGHKVILVKPQTYMNRSGECLGELIDYLGIDEESELIVVFDDVSLEPGDIRIRRKGSSGGHNGIKSIIQHLGSQVFMRVKVGIGKKPEKFDLADYVLGHFSQEDKDTMQSAYESAAEAAVMCMVSGADKAMNEYNCVKKTKSKETEADEGAHSPLK